ncbi:MAG: biotin--[acetyl-CoA-carboxylase] ligase [Nitrospiraceae bacterium]|nr:biotin--[acetyl-CoA-carboxylase] ligase [Nitrospiraceae bacterium]
MSVSRPLTCDDIRSTLGTRHLGHRLAVFTEVASTNQEVMRLAQSGAEHGTVVVAESQTAGRGRQSRSWFSPPHVNLYTSILVRPLYLNLSFADWLGWLPLTTAIAATESIRQVAGVQLALKWPNDLLLHDRKAGGILCEAGSDQSRQPFVVIGLGLNVNARLAGFPAELAQIASSLMEATGQPVDRNRLLAQFLGDLEDTLDELATTGPHRLRQVYMTRSATIGKRVRVSVSPQGEWVGDAFDIGLDGALHVRPSGTTPGSSPPFVELRAAEVLHVRE